jgi:hypothetical protein
MTGSFIVANFLFSFISGKKKFVASFKLSTYPSYELNKKYGVKGDDDQK